LDGDDMNFTPETSAIPASKSTIRPYVMASHGEVPKSSDARFV
jgi:hypothetical protein